MSYINFFEKTLTAESLKVMHPYDEVRTIIRTIGGIEYAANIVQSGSGLGKEKQWRKTRGDHHIAQVMKKEAIRERLSHKVVARKSNPTAGCKN
jgi:hypothetical protein